MQRARVTLRPLIHASERIWREYMQGNTLRSRRNITTWRPRGTASVISSNVERLAPVLHTAVYLAPRLFEKRLRICSAHARVPKNNRTCDAAFPIALRLPRSPLDSSLHPCDNQLRAREAILPTARRISQGKVAGLSLARTISLQNSAILFQDRMRMNDPLAIAREYGIDYRP